MIRSNTLLFALLYGILIMACSVTATAQAQARAVDCQVSTFNNNVAAAGQEVGLKNGAPLIYDKFFFSKIALGMNKAAPYDAGYGMAVSSVAMEENSINVTLTCDYSTYLCLSLLDYDIAEDYKFELTMGWIEVFDAMGIDDNGDSIETKMESLGLEFNYSLYVSGYQDAVASFKITGDYIMAIYEYANGIFSV